MSHIIELKFEDGPIKQLDVPVSCKKDSDTFVKEGARALVENMVLPKMRIVTPALTSPLIKRGMN